MGKKAARLAFLPRQGHFGALFAVPRPRPIQPKKSPGGVPDWIVINSVEQIHLVDGTPLWYDVGDSDQP
jgi:hypothetical protein